MKNTTPDPAEPIGEVTIVNDFLPPPEQLVPKKNKDVNIPYLVHRQSYV